ncbi:hypothetical protein EDC04DRAFT_2992942 [Pisolithus marmoratus]|nr:hypothetical protein EDC04DRAFT_2992942 [Pisolithus marmoratus]
MLQLRISAATIFLSLLASGLVQIANATGYQTSFTLAGTTPNHTKVLILGGGMAGVIAARTLQKQGIEDFLIVEANDKFGGRMIGEQFGVNGSKVFIEKGANWIHGTKSNITNRTNPVWDLAQKHKLQMNQSHLFENISYFNYNGSANYSETFKKSMTDFDKARDLAEQRWKQNKTDMDLRSLYKTMGIVPKTPEENACEYYQIDYECEFYYAQDPSRTSSLASAWNYDYTFDPKIGYSDEDWLSVDKRGIAYIVQEEARISFDFSKQVLFNQIVTTIQYNDKGVTVQTTGSHHGTTGYTLTADHVLVTFSAGVLQGTDVAFEPPLPDWKLEAINSIEMGVYTKIFLQFKEKFWFNTEIGLYADPQRGKYPVWQNLDHPDFLPGSKVIFATVAGDYAKYLEQLHNHTLVQREVMEVLQRMYPNKKLDDPIAIFLPIWGRAPLFRGSYSNWGAPFVPKSSDDLRAPVKGHLWFAGEGTSLYYSGFMHGAYLEGEDAAKKIAACINNSTQCPPAT